jgi:predicted DNA-binding transcriptional regulator AlpA
MYDLPSNFFPEFTLYRIVLPTIGGRLPTQNFLKVFVKNCQDRLHRFKSTRLSLYMTNLMNIHDLQAMLKLRRTATYQVTNGPDFPAAIYLSDRTKRWEKADVELWLQSRKGMKQPVRSKSKPIKESDLFDGVRFVRVGA